MKNYIKFYLKSEYTNCYQRFKSLQSAKVFITKCRKDNEDHLQVFSSDMILLCEKLPNSKTWTLN